MFDFWLLKISYKNDIILIKEIGISTMDQKKYIFLSYSRKDSMFALKLAEELRGRGFDVWMDRSHILSGDQWRQNIDHAIRNSHALVWVVSPTSVNSNYVHKEVSFAEVRNVSVLPVVYKESDIPFPWHDLHFVNMDKDYDEGFEELMRSLDSVTVDNMDDKSVLTRLNSQILVAKTPSDLNNLSYKIEEYLYKYPQKQESYFLMDTLKKYRNQLKLRTASYIGLFVALIGIIIFLSISNTQLTIANHDTNTTMLNGTGVEVKNTTTSGNNSPINISIGN